MKRKSFAGLRTGYLGSVSTLETNPVISARAARIQEDLTEAIAAAGSKPLPRGLSAELVARHSVRSEEALALAVADPSLLEITPRDFFAGSVESRWSYAHDLDGEILNWLGGKLRDYGAYAHPAEGDRRDPTESERLQAVLEQHPGQATWAELIVEQPEPAKQLADVKQSRIDGLLRRESSAEDLLKALVAQAANSRIKHEVRGFTADLLEPHSYDVARANSQRVALELAQDQAPRRQQVDAALTNHGLKPTLSELDSATPGAPSAPARHDLEI